MINPFDPQDELVKFEEIRLLRLSMSNVLNVDSSLESVNEMMKLCMEYLDWNMNHPRLVYSHTNNIRFQMARLLLEFNHYYNDCVDQSRICEKTVEKIKEDNTSIFAKLSSFVIGRDDKKVH